MIERSRCISLPLLLTLSSSLKVSSPLLFPSKGSRNFYVTYLFSPPSALAYSLCFVPQAKTLELCATLAAFCINLHISKFDTQSKT